MALSLSVASFTLAAGVEEFFIDIPPPDGRGRTHKSYQMYDSGRREVDPESGRPKPSPLMRFVTGKIYRVPRRIAEAIASVRNNPHDSQSPHIFRVRTREQFTADAVEEAKKKDPLYALRYDLANAQNPTGMPEAPTAIGDTGALTTEALRRYGGSVSGPQVTPAGPKMPLSEDEIVKSATDAGFKPDQNGEVYGLKTFDGEGVEGDLKIVDPRVEALEQRVGKIEQAQTEQTGMLKDITGMLRDNLKKNQAEKSEEKGDSEATFG